MPACVILCSYGSRKPVSLSTTWILVVKFRSLGLAASTFAEPSPACGGSNDNVPHRLRCLNTWSPVDVCSLGSLGGVALLKEVCHWEQALGFKCQAPFPLCSLPPAETVQDVSLHLSKPPTLSGTFLSWGLLVLWSCKSKHTLLSLSCLGHGP